LRIVDGKERWRKTEGRKAQVYRPVGAGEDNFVVALDVRLIGNHQIPGAAVLEIAQDAQTILKRQVNQEMAAKDEVGGRGRSFDQIASLERNLLGSKPPVILFDHLRDDVISPVPGQVPGEIERGKPIVISAGSIDYSVNIQSLDRVQ
jgi:hypothetical protein